MSIKEIQSKSLVNRNKQIDSWFLSRYSMNLYRGCLHDCAYCDGRAESYHVEGRFGCDVEVKTNAELLLRKALDQTRKRKPLIPSYVLLGGGVGDSYQPVDRKYGLARKSLSVLADMHWPVHILTKSSLVERDRDILRDMHLQSNVIVSMSFSGVDEELSKLFEPGTSTPQRRLETLDKMKNEGFHTGVFLMPVLPGLTDTEEQLDASLSAFKNVGVDFVLFGGMTLKEGRQKDHYMAIIQQHFPELIPLYEAIYKGDKWGNADSLYYKDITNRFSEVAKRNGVNRRIPHKVFQHVLTLNDQAVVILQGLDYLAKLDKRPSPYLTAARAIQKLEQPLIEFSGELRSIPGVGTFTEKLLNELIRDGSSTYYDSVLK